MRDDDPESIGGYRLLARVGAGGMGRVYLGESAAGFRVAVKVIKPSVLDEEGRARFVSEVESLRTVYGPFVAAFVAADAEAERPWLAVEYVPGPDLVTLVAERGPLPTVEAASLGALLAEGLSTVHTAGLLHRDLKPHNVLLSPQGPKVIDFGLAVLAERRISLTATGVVVGSVHCMSPEQARGEFELGPAADVYALGAVLLYAATGHYPYTGATWQAVALAITDPVRAPDLTGLPRELTPLVSSMLAADPAERPGLTVVIEGLVSVIRAAGSTAAGAKRRLDALVPEPEWPEPPDAAPPAVPPYTPAVLDVAARATDDEDTEAGAGDAGDSPGDVAEDAGDGEDGVPDPDASGAWPEPVPVPPETGAGPGAGTDPAGGTGGAGGTGRPAGGVRPTVPLRVAERLRTTYAADARF
nr:serine/threonine-protein kinase [Streptomyces alkaliphilus]